MAKLHELRPLIDRGNKAVLFFKTEDGETVKASIGKDAQEHVTHTLFYPDRPNPFPQPQTERYSSWKHLLEDMTDLQTMSDQWSIEE